MSHLPFSHEPTYQTESTVFKLCLLCISKNIYFKIILKTKILKKKMCKNGLSIIRALK